MSKMSAEEFDERFDASKDMTPALDLPAERRPGLEHRRVNVDFPSPIIEKLDREAMRCGATRQSLIKVWIAERLEHRGGNAA